MVERLLRTSDHGFGSAPDFHLGLEEELLLVDRADHALAHVASAVIARVAASRGEIKPDLYEALVELTAPPAADAALGAAELRAGRRAVSAAGGTPMGAGIHPAAAFGDVVHVPGARYAEVARQLAGLGRRTPTAALHVHVAVPDRHAAIRVFNGLRRWLPALQALAANSPFWHGVDSGMATARASLFRSYPRAGVPRALRSWAEWEERAAAALAPERLDDYTFLWWDLRPHGRLGTVELRAMDAQSSLGAVAGLGALVQGLARAAAEAPAPSSEPSAEAIAGESYVAARDGLDGPPARAAAEAALSLARSHGDDPALEEVERILRDGGGAERQRAAHARAGMAAVLEGLVRETAAETVLTRHG